MGKHTLSRNPTKTVEIDGREYEMEMGNLTVAIEAKRWAQKLEGMAAEDIYEVIDALADGAREIVASVLGEQAAEELIGGRNRLNIMRMLDLLEIIVDEVTADDAVSALEQSVARFADTADED